MGEEKQGGKKTEKKKFAVLELAGLTFDSQNGELTLGDLEELEHKGIELTKMKEGEGLSITKTRVVAQACLCKSNPDANVDSDFMAAIPASKIGELGEFIADFFAKSLPEKKRR